MKVKKYLYLYLALWLVFPCIVFIISTAGYNLLIGTKGTAFFIQGILNCIAAFCGIILAFLHYRRTEKALTNKGVLFVTVVCITFLMLCGNFLCRLFDSVEEYHSFCSPDGAHTIVIMENVSFISGQVVLYERVNPFLIYPKERIITDDGYRPICAGEYLLVWQGNTVTLSVSDGAGEEKIISVTLSED